MTSIQKTSSASQLNRPLEVLSPIQKLPDELVAKILRNLGKQSKETRLVCKKLNWSYCQSISLAKTLVSCKSENFQFISPKLFSNLQNLEVAIIVKKDISSSIFLDVSKYNNLKKLVISAFKLPEDFLFNIFLPQLRSAHIVSNDSYLNGSGLRPFFKSSPQLEHLKLRNVAFDGNISIELHDLHLNLKELALADIKGNGDQNLSRLFASASKIEILRILSCNGLNGRCFINLSQMLPRLIHLDFLSSKELNPSILSEIADPSFTKLEKLYLCGDGLNDRAVERVLELSPCLKKLSVGGSQLTGSFFNSESSHFSLLEDVSIMGYSVDRNISSHNLGCLFRKAPNLARFCCKNKKGNDFGNLDDCLRNLTFLDLREDYDLEDQALSQITHSAHNLTSVYLNYCKNVTSAAINEMINRCPKIETLDLGMCEMNPDGFIADIGSRLPNLKHLNLYSINLTANNFGQIVRISHLESLDIDCSDVSDADMFQKLPCLTNLEEIDLPSTAVDMTLFALALRMPKLRTIRLTTCKEERETTQAGVELAIECAEKMGRTLNIET